MTDKRIVDPNLHLSRRGLLGLGAALGVGAAVSACGGGSASGPGGGAAADLAEGPYDGPKVTLNFWNGFTGGDGPFMREMVETFNKDHENIEVKMNTLQWSDFYSKLPNAVASGAGPDVAAMHVDQIATNAARNVIIPLDEFVGALDLDEENFDPTIWKAGVYNDQRYGIPLDVHPLGFYYNTQHFEKAGLSEPPQDQESWQAALVALQEKAGIDKPFWATATWPAHIIFISLLQQFGGQLYNDEGTEATFASEAGVKALNWYTGHIPEYSPPNVTNDAEVQAFQQGRNSMTFNGIWMMNVWNEVDALQWAAAPLPQIGEQPGVWASSHQLVVTRQKSPDENKLHAARTFLAFLSEDSIRWAESGQVPARNSVRESEEFAALETQSTLASQLDAAVYPPSVAGIGDVTAPTFETAVNLVVLGKAEAEPALQQAQDKANELLKQNRAKYEA